jgi:uncharacterized membrane protein
MSSRGLKMVNLIPVHSMLVELHGGMLTLAVICIIATVAARSHMKMRKTNETYGIFWPADSFMGKLARYTEPTAYLAGIGGVVGIMASAIVGFYVWPMELITTSALALSKIMFSVFALELWIVFVFLRSKYGENLWKNGGTAAVYSLLAIFGFLFVVLAGSLGGHMALKGSVLDPLYSLLGIDPVTFGVTGINFVIVLVSISLFATVVPTAVFLYFQRRAKPKLVAPTP